MSASTKKQTKFNHTITIWDSLLVTAALTDSKITALHTVTSACCSDSETWAQTCCKPHSCIIFSKLMHCWTLVAISSNWNRNHLKNVSSSSYFSFRTVVEVWFSLPLISLKIICNIIFNKGNKTKQKTKDEKQFTSGSSLSFLYICVADCGKFKFPHCTKWNCALDSEKQETQKQRQHMLFCHVSCLTLFLFSRSALRHVHAVESTISIKLDLYSTNS